MEVEDEDEDAKKGKVWFRRRAELGYLKFLVWRVRVKEVRGWEQRTLDLN